MSALNGEGGEGRVSDALQYREGKEGEGRGGGVRKAPLKLHVCLESTAFLRAGLCFSSHRFSRCNPKGHRLTCCWMLYLSAKEHRNGVTKKHTRGSTAPSIPTWCSMRDDMKNKRRKRRPRRVGLSGNALLTMRAATKAFRRFGLVLEECG